MIAWNRDVNLLYGMFALVSSTVIVAATLPRFALNNVTAQRLLPAAAFEGEQIDICVTMQNHGRSARFMLEALDCMPAAAPDKRAPLVFAGRLAGRTQRDFSYRILCFKRGDYMIGPLRLRSAYPLGLSWSERGEESSQPTLLVYPAMFEIAYFPLLVNGSLVMSGMEAMAKSGGNDDFFGTREYRRGDSLHHIHWPSTARHGQLIVKEFEIRASTELSIILDLQCESNLGHEREATLEYAVRIAASVARYALERGHSVQLSAYGRNPAIVASGKGMHHLPAILKMLARVEADGSVPYAEAISRTAPLMKDGSCALLFFTDDLQRDDNLYSFELLRAKRIRPIAVSFDRASFTDASVAVTTRFDPLEQTLFAQDIPVYRVARGDELSEVFV